MKHIYVSLLLVFLAIATVKAQDTPCEIQRKAWQTIAIYENGEIQMLVETSQCNGNSICGQPVIGLKHTLSSAAWIKIRVRGYNCNNQMIEKVFSTNGKLIQPDQPYFASENVHSFDRIIKVSKVEANYDVALTNSLELSFSNNVVKKVEEPIPAATETSKPQTTQKEQVKEEVIPMKQPHKMTDDTLKRNVRLNVIKTNLLYPFTIGYERAIGNHFSILGNVSYFPKASIGSETSSFGQISFDTPAIGYCFEGRYYTSQKKAPLNGIYLGGFFTLRKSDIIGKLINETANTTTKIEFTTTTGLWMAGAMIGKQKIRKRGFTSDISFGLGYYRVLGVPNLSTETTASNTFAYWTKYRKGIAPRVTFSLGYAF